MVLRLKCTLAIQRSDREEEAMIHRLGLACWLLLWTLVVGYGAEKKQIHGMLTVRTEDGETWWCKYHNIATVTGR